MSTPLSSQRGATHVSSQQEGPGTQHAPAHMASLGLSTLGRQGDAQPLPAGSGCGIGVSHGSVAQSSARDVPSVPHPEAPVLLPLTEPGGREAAPCPEPRAAARCQGRDARRGLGRAMPTGGDARRLCPPRAGSKASVTRSPPLPVSLPLFLPKVWEEAMAAAAAPLLSGQRSLVQRQLLGAQLGQGFSLQQPQTKVSVAVGETLSLNCTTSENSEPGPVKWLKGWDRGNKIIYDQTTKDPSSRVTRAMNKSSTDFTIHIRNVQPEDTGTYYCVKFVKSDSGGDEVFQRGNGTEVSVHERALVPVTGAVAVVLCFLLLLLLGLFVALCVYRRKRQGELGSPFPARTVPMGSFSSVSLWCCTGTPGTPSEVLEAESSHLPSQQSSKEENDIHYADLQPLPPAPRRGRSPGTAPTEYASLRAAAK